MVSTSVIVVLIKTKSLEAYCQLTTAIAHQRQKSGGKSAINYVDFHVKILVFCC